MHILGLYLIGHGVIRCVTSEWSTHRTVEWLGSQDGSKGATKITLVMSAKDGCPVHFER